MSRSLPSFGVDRASVFVHIFQLPLTISTAGVFRAGAAAAAAVVVGVVSFADVIGGEVVPASVVTTGADTVLPDTAPPFLPPLFFPFSVTSGTLSTTGLALSLSDCLNTLIARLASSWELNVARAMPGKHSSVSRGSPCARMGVSSDLIWEPILSWVLGDRGGPVAGALGSSSSLHVIASFRNLPVVLGPEREGSEVERVALGVLGGVGGKWTSGGAALACGCARGDCSPGWDCSEGGFDAVGVVYSSAGPPRVVVGSAANIASGLMKRLLSLKKGARTRTRPAPEVSS